MSLGFHPVPKPPKRIKVRKPLKARAVPKAFAKHRVPAFHKWVATFACLLADRGECDGRIEAHHIFGRKADDVGTEVPLCQLHHQQWGLWGRLTWQRRYKIDAALAAKQLGQKWIREFAPCP